MFSLDLGRLVSFPGGHGGRKQPVAGVVGRRVEDRILFARGRAIRRSGSPTRAAATRTASLRSASDVSPVWNPRTSNQIAFVSGRTGEPQIYIMDQDGANVQRMTDGGYAISPSWSPNGGMLAFAGTANTGPAIPAARTFT